MSTGSASDRVVAVIVTCRRAALLREGLGVLAAQTRLPDHLVVVDNGDDEETREVVAAWPGPVEYLPSKDNLGGAGGFALGMLTALRLGADWVWCADDDGRPGAPDTLEVLLREATDRRLGELSPAVVDIADPDRFAFPVRTGLRWSHRVSQMRGQDFLPGYASLFNGALFARAALHAVGVPDLRLFLRGDETEIHRRLVRAGVAFGTTLRAAYHHPQGSDEFRPILGGRLSAQYPDDAAKRFFVYRNRGYLMSQPGMRWLYPLELVRFGWFFASRRDWAGLRTWLRLTGDGRRERFRRPG